MQFRVSDLNQDVYDLSDIDDLSKSICEVGLLQPLVINQRRDSSAEQVISTRTHYYDDRKK